MEGLRRLFTTCFGMGLAVFLSIQVMIHGWGLDPKSYGWIIGVGVFGQIAALTITQIGLKKDE